MKIPTLIIDDEAPARKLLRTHLDEIDVIDVVGECRDGIEGLKSIQNLQPRLIFLDIHMPRLDGLEMLELIEEPPEVIFITAYDQYAIRAFEQNAIDYLLKPFEANRLLAAIQKVEARMASGKQAHLTNAIRETIVPGHAALSRIVAKTGHKIRVIEIEEIIFIEAQDDYVMFYLEQEKYLKQQTMRYYENHLSEEKFIRIHRSYIVNIQYVNSIDLNEKDSYFIKLKDGRSIPVSKSGYANLRDKLNF